jgi:hypothetical protein
LIQGINYGFYFRVVVEDVAAAEGQKEDCLAGEELFQEGQIQVPSRETFGFEKEFCSSQDVVAGEKVFRKTFVAEEVSEEMGGEEDVGFKDQVGLGEEDEEDFL